ncbi:hypothetical protein NL108_014113 [Boleophthalmus pectinirostris]|nr:hypothetical protein NL108_014113 [Boleophthalmus pectinirostris]
MVQACGFEMFLATLARHKSYCHLQGPDVTMIPANISLNTTHLHITKAKHLQQMDRGAFRNIPKLRYLLISNTGLNVFPDLGQIHSTATDFIFDFHDNIYITEVPPNAFRGLCSQTIRDIRLSRNSIERVERDAFNGTRMRRLFLADNTRLTHFSPDAFSGSSGLLLL